MKIAYIAAGAAGMYCGTCLSDNTLAAALKAQGHDVLLVPTYTPIRVDEHDESIDRVFYGALNVYLGQKSALFRRAPRFLARALAARPVLGLISRFSSSTDARLLGELTISMLEGEQGNQKAELEELVSWLEKEVRPDVVHLTNSMFVGLARPIKDRLRVPVVCSLQGEDLFLDAMREPYRTRVLDLIRDKSRDVDAFIAPSRYYVEHMAEFAGLPRDRMHHVPMGIRLDEFPEAAAERDPASFTIGYFARICPEKGFETLVDAFLEIRRRPDTGNSRLRVAGWLGDGDRKFYDKVAAKIEAAGVEDGYHYAGELDHAEKIEFLRNVDVLSVPTTYREPKGRFVLEALACGTPVVLPRHGAFPELLEALEGGLLVDPGSPGDLARGLLELRDDPVRSRELGVVGRRRLRESFDEKSLARATLAVYDRLLEQGVASDG